MDVSEIRKILDALPVGGQWFLKRADAEALLYNMLEEANIDQVVYAELARPCHCDFKIFDLEEDTDKNGFLFTKQAPADAA
jgi:hypothetical protein